MLCVEFMRCALASGSAFLFCHAMQRHSASAACVATLQQICIQGNLPATSISLSELSSLMSLSKPTCLLDSIPTTLLREFFSTVSTSKNGKLWHKRVCHLKVGLGLTYQNALSMSMLIMNPLLLLKFIMEFHRVLSPIQFILYTLPLISKSRKHSINLHHG